MLILPRRYTSQPPKRSRVDASHPILAGVSNAIIQYGDVNGWRGNNATGEFGSLIQDPTLNGTLASDYTDAGPALKFDGSTTYADFGTANIPTDEFTVMWGGVFDALSGVTGIVDCCNGTSNGWSLFTSGTDMYLSGNHYSGDLLASGWATGTFYHGAARNKAGVGISIFRNGAKIANSGIGLTGVSNPTNPFLVGQLRVSGPRFITGRFAYFYLLDKYLDDQQIADIAVNPYRILSPQRKLYLVGSTSSGATGTVNITNANDTLAASGTTTVIGSLARTSGNDTLAASGTTTIKGSLAKTNANDTSAANGTTTVTGALAVANANDTVSASGSVGSSVSGSVNYTNADDTSAANGTTTVIGSLARTDAGDSVAAAGTTTVTGSLAATNADDSCSASGTVTSGATGTLAVTNADDSVSASGTTTIKGSLANANRNDLVAASGTVNNGIVFEDALTGVKATSAGIKKPGIPATAPDWLRTILETVIGRRGNAIVIPSAQTLTFSSTPTKAECEALYAYVNSVRDATEAILNRLDG
jgi:hypothetical protein